MSTGGPNSAEIRVFVASFLALLRFSLLQKLYVSYGVGGNDASNRTRAVRGRWIRRGESKNEKGYKILVSATILLWLAAVSVLAQELETGRVGTLGCIGKHFFRAGEIEITNLAFRNFNADRTIRITDITIFSDAGTILATLSPGPGAFAV